MPTEYNDRKALFLSLRLILVFVVVSGLITIMFTMSMTLSTLREVRHITEFLNIPNTGLSGYPLPQPSLVGNFAFTIVAFMMVAVLMVLVVVTLRRMDDFADPPKAIKKLEERISALRAKGRNHAR
jgi:hypothetical protein